MSRIVVIGAGVGGLAVAARLGAAGHRVSVYEQGTAVGGRLGRYERATPAGTFRFDTGPSLLTLPRVFAEFFEATGTRLADELDLVPLDPVVRHVFPTVRCWIRRASRRCSSRASPAPSVPPPPTTGARCGGGRPASGTRPGATS